MKNYTNASPSFSETISIPENTDPANAESVLNVPTQQIHDNTLFLKKVLDGLGLSVVDGKVCITFTE